jgi:hypothetical protein
MWNEGSPGRGRGAILRGTSGSANGVYILSSGCGPSSGEGTAACSRERFGRKKVYATPSESNRVINYMTTVNKRFGAGPAVDNKVLDILDTHQQSGIQEVLGEVSVLLVDFGICSRGLHTFSRMRSKLRQWHSWMQSRKSRKEESTTHCRNRLLCKLLKACR